MRRHLLITSARMGCMLLLANALVASGLCVAAEKKPLKVYILVGQSNMQGHARIGTFEHMAMDPETAPLLARMRNEDGTPRVCQDVWISYLSSSGVKTGRLSAGFGADEGKIGPEFTFGITMQQALGEPILLIKAAWGGKSLHTDFRPPGAGPFPFSEQQIESLAAKGKDVAAIRAKKQQATGHYYRLTLDHVKSVLANIAGVYPHYDESQGHQLAGLVWFQGWNDMVDSGVYPARSQPGGYDDYTRLLEHFIRDLRQDLAAPGLPVVIGVMGVGGPVEQYRPEQQRYQSVHQNFRMAMAAAADLPEFKGQVVAVLTERFWDMELDALVWRNEKVKRELKKLQVGNKLTGAPLQALQTELRNKEFSERELKMLETGISNAAYHYLGSGKIMALIGEGFAKAMLGLQAN